MAERVLIAASVASFMIQFNMSDIRILKEMGYEVDVCGNFREGNSCSDEELERLKSLLREMDVKYFHIDFSRSGTALGRHIKAYRQMKKLLSENDYAFVHFHSPIGGAIGRLAAHYCGTPAIYTAHGFHFYDGAPLKNWLIFYPIERFLSKYTDILLVMNKEDSNRAVRDFKAKRTILIPGVGVDIERFAPPSDKEALGDELRRLRGELGADDDTFLLLSVGEMTVRKNHRAVIEALGMLRREKGDFPRKVIYAVAGKPEPEEDLSAVAAENGISDMIRLLGYRNDISLLNAAADAFVFPSKQEGLPLSLMEAMAAGTPVIPSRIRGNVDLVADEQYMYAPTDVKALSVIFEKMIFNNTRASWKAENEAYTKECLLRLSEFDIKNVDRIMEKIYREMGNIDENSVNKRGRKR